MPLDASGDEQLAEDMGTFFDDPYGFVMYAFPWGKGTLKHFDGPEQWACDFFKELGEQIKANNFNGSEAVKGIREATSSGHGIAKSATTAMLILFIMSTRPYCKGVVTANTSAQLNSKTWAELAKWKNLCITGHWFKLNNAPNSMKMYHIDHPETWRVDAYTSAKENSESFAGLHAANSTPFYIFDEASAIPDEIWTVAEGGQTDGEPMWFAFGNPTRNTGRFKECFGRFRNRWNTRKIDSRNVKITNKAQIEEWVQDYGEDSDFVRVRVKGDFPRASSSQFIPTDLVEAAAKRIPIDLRQNAAPLVLGLDVARFGADSSVLVARKGRDAKTIPLKSWRGIDLMQLAGEVSQIIRQLRPDAVFIDEGGVGGGVVDRLKQLNYGVMGVNFGGKPDGMVDGVLVANKRAEMWAKCREWLKGEVSLQDDMTLHDDLIGVEYGFNSRNEIQLERKEDMTKRGLASPDRGDALCLTFAHDVAPAGASYAQEAWEFDEEDREDASDVTGY